ncbi:hypothetical protein RC74_17640 [Falsihalocynthiibacter arcticus]|uniref:Uncharacterized protein n=1 Tax=Falsihalocynthiibacter arcticus TaxID=1579316 RepID=A0A126V3F2_9RHOB|nr:hypothetical protein RC74_17640 [Falsihalocynthiibacter arcticus]
MLAHGPTCALARVSYLGARAPKRRTSENSVDQFYAAIWSLFTLRLTPNSDELFVETKMGKNKAIAK